MTPKTTQTFQPTWQALTWRIVLTISLLLFLAGPGITLFEAAVG